MSFETGHHATTFLMIEMMQFIDFINKNVLDFGTGTGVLAILAEKLKAASVLAIDNDEWSITNAQENIENNNCKKILIQKKDNIQGLSFVDIILANLNFNTLNTHAFSLSELLLPSSLLLISGILVKDEKLLTEKFHLHKLIKKQTAMKDGWVAILFQKE